MYKKITSLRNFGITGKGQMGKFPVQAPVRIGGRGCGGKGESPPCRFAVARHPTPQTWGCGACFRRGQLRHPALRRGRGGQGAHAGGSVSGTSSPHSYLVGCPAWSGCGASTRGCWDRRGRCIRPIRLHTAGSHASRFALASPCRTRAVCTLRSPCYLQYYHHLRTLSALFELITQFAMK